MRKKTAIYLDYNATAPLLPQAKEAMMATMGIAGNASSVHSHGRKLRTYVDTARRELLESVDAKDARLIFTGSATEANNMVLKGVVAKSVLISAVEHISIYQARDDMHHIPVDDHGVVQLAALDQLLKDLPQPALVSVMLVNNETGVIQPLKEITRIAHSYGAIMHTDAVQALGKIFVSFRHLGVDMMTLGAHKFGGPSGVGALVMREGFNLKPLITGGGHEQGLRAGTQNAALIEGFRVASHEASRNLAKYQELRVLRDQLEEDLLAFCPKAKVYGSGARRVANTSYIAMPGVSSEVQLMAFDLAGISLSTGAACSSGKVQASHVLKAMGVKTPDQEGVIRVSLGWNTTSADIAAFIKIWKQIYTTHLKGNT